MVGRAVLKKFRNDNFKNILIRTSSELDLINQLAVNDFFKSEKPEIVILCAGKVGGIGANKKYPTDFLYKNLMIWCNVIIAASENNVEKLIFLGSATIYPQYAELPFKEESILTGSLDPNTEPYAIAKIAGIKLCEALYRTHKKNFYTLTLANLYGPYDHFDDENSHVVPALISRIYRAKEDGTDNVVVWGSGKPTRDLLFVLDLADLIEFALLNIDAKDIYNKGISHLNAGTGIEHPIKELVSAIVEAIGYNGKVIFDTSKPDGTMRKSVDASRINALGWRAQTSLKDGIKQTIDYYISTKNQNKKDSI